MVKKVALMLLMSLSFGLFAKGKNDSLKEQIKSLEIRINNLEKRLKIKHCGKKSSCPATCKCGENCACNPCKC